MKTFILEVTPKQAQAWLDRNVGNRAVSEKAVSNYARDMTEGRWAYTGDSIKFCCSKVSDGKVLGKSITNTYPVTMGVAYYESGDALGLVNLSGDNENIS